MVSEDDMKLPPAQRLLKTFRAYGYPLDRYRPPYTIDCYFQGMAYIGTFFFFREKEQPPFSPQTFRRLEKIEPFLTFALSYVVARTRVVHPENNWFVSRFNSMVDSAGLTHQEAATAWLLLYGYSYAEVASRRHLSIDTIRKHVKRIFLKTETHSSGELFARYFTPRLSF